MPRNEKQVKVHPQPQSVQSIIPRMSYTGPLMPRPTPVESSNPSFMQTVKQGFSFGVGTSLARNMVDSIFGSSGASGPSVPSTTPVPVPASASASAPLKPPTVGSIEPIGEDQQLYHKCMQEGDPKSLVRHEYCKNFLI